jgi:hypothetical protein
VPELVTHLHTLTHTCTNMRTQWFVGNVIHNSLMQTSAFEIWSNDQLVRTSVSKLCCT